MEEDAIRERGAKPRQGSEENAARAVGQRSLAIARHTDAIAPHQRIVTRPDPNAAEAVAADEIGLDVERRGAGAHQPPKIPGGACSPRIDPRVVAAGWEEG